MTRRRRTRARHGATVMECAIIIPFTLFLLIALYVGSMGIFRYQEVSTLAREGARYASTHGYQYRRDANLSLGTATDWQADIITNGVTPYITSLDSSLLTIEVT